jgi:hypothetical protein
VWRGQEINSLSPYIDVRTTFSDLDPWFAASVSFLDDDIIAPLTANSYIRLSYTVCPAGRSNAGFVADLGRIHRHRN